jgi:hypothetical protein
MYDTVLGRFISRDPIGYADGMGLYAYVNNAPPRAVDPEGTFRLDLTRFFPPSERYPNDPIQGTKSNYMAGSLQPQGQPGLYYVSAWMDASMAAQAQFWFTVAAVGNEVIKNSILNAGVSTFLGLTTKLQMRAAWKTFDYYEWYGHVRNRWALNGLQSKFTYYGRSGVKEGRCDVSIQYQWCSMLTGVIVRTDFAYLGFSGRCDDFVKSPQYPLMKTGWGLRRDLAPPAVR